MRETKYCSHLLTLALETDDLMEIGAYLRSKAHKIVITHYLNGGRKEYTKCRNEYIQWMCNDCYKPEVSLGG
jgi:hypothetical protein